MGLASLWFPVTTDLITPIFGIVLTCICLPYWQANISELPIQLPQKIISSAPVSPVPTARSFQAASRIIYFLELLLSVLFSPNYISSVVGRIVTSYNVLMIVLSLWVSGQVTLEAVMFDFLLNTLLIEYICYYLNHQRLKLFLEKERSNYKSKQTQDILNAIPTSVIVFRAMKRVFQNDHATELIKDVSEQLFHSNLRTNFDRDGEFYNKRFFKYYTKNGRYRQPRTVSINEMVADPSIIKENDHFEVSLYKGQVCTKRVYQITIENIVLDANVCLMLLIRD
jgi:hypothetical protein